MTLPSGSLHIFTGRSQSTGMADTPHDAAGELHASQQASHMARPFSVTLLSLIVLSLTAWNGLRLEASIASWKALEEFETRPGPLYIALSGAFWLPVGIIVFVALWWGKAWARKAAFFAVTGYTSWYWFDRLILQYPHAGWPFALAVSIILFIYTWLTLQGSRKFFAQIKTSRREHEL